MIPAFPEATDAHFHYNTHNYSLTFLLETDLGGVTVIGCGLIQAITYSLVIAWWAMVTAFP